MCKAINILKSNIAMFEGYKPTPHVEASLAGFRSALVEWERHLAGELRREDMSYQALTWGDTMPAWGISGT